MGPAVSAGVGLALSCAVTAGALGGTGGEPVPIIFDTDMGNDIDDALALAMIHTLADRGEARDGDREEARHEHHRGDHDGPADAAHRAPDGILGRGTGGALAAVAHQEVDGVVDGDT